MSTLSCQFLVAVDSMFCISVLTIAQSYTCLLPLLWLLVWLNHRIDFSQKSTKYLSTQSFVQKKKSKSMKDHYNKSAQISDRGFCNRRLRSYSIFMTVPVSSSFFFFFLFFNIFDWSYLSRKCCYCTQGQCLAEWCSSNQSNRI